jgi:MoaA/NifB/PqqE/SkfB family radical SAM enzyme
MYRDGEVKRIHLELTTKCNASCPQCLRNVRGGKVSPNLPLTELSLQDVQHILPPAILRTLEHITICGNYGDALVAKEALEICEYFRAWNPDIDIEFHTNGSGRSPEFWSRLALSVNRCVFAIDGLEDTNHIYRRNTNWNKVMESVTAFIGAGGHAVWNFIVFRHNEHQVKKASALARKLGFLKFYAKRTGRFVRHGKVSSETPILDAQGRVVGKLQLPQNSTFRNPVAEDIAEDFKSENDYEDWISSTNITCSAARGRGIFISAEGFVFPCCWMAQIYSPGLLSRRKRQVIEMMGGPTGDLSGIDALQRPLEAIVNSQLFRSTIPAGWEKGSGRLEICARQCGDRRLSANQKKAVSLGENWGDE